MRSPRRHVGGRGVRGRDLSPPPPRTARAREHHRDDWEHRDSYKSRRSPIPLMRDFPQRGSPELVERRDYGSTSSRGLDPGDQHREQSIPFHSLHQGDLPGLAYDEEVHGRDAYNNLRHKYVLRDRPLDKHMDMSRPIRIKEMHPVGDGGIPPPSPCSIGALDGKDILVSRSMHMEDGSIRAFFTLPPDPGSYASGSSAFASKNTSGSGAGKELGFQYRHHIRERYDDGDKEMYRDVSHTGMPSLQPRAFGGVASDLLEKGGLGSYRDALHFHSKDYCDFSGVDKFKDESFGRDEYHIPLLDSVKRRAPSPIIREDVRNQGYSEFVRRERSHHVLTASDDIYNQMSWEHREGQRGVTQSVYVDHLGGTVDESVHSPKTMTKAQLWDHHPSFERDSTSDYCNINMVPEEFIPGRKPLEFRTRSPQGHEFSHAGREYDYARDDDLACYRERSRSPVMAGRYGDIYTEDVSPPPRRIYAEDMDTYDRPVNIVSRRRYVADDEAHEVDNRNFHLSNRHGSDNLWSSEDRGYLSSSKRYNAGNSQHKFLSQRLSGSDKRSLHQNSVRIHQGGPHTNLKMRLRPAPSKFHDSVGFSRKQDICKPQKFWKKSQDSQYDIRSAHGVDVSELEKHAKSDPPEDSEEFRQQVQKAFLRFSKLLNENPHQKKRITEQGKAGSLLCYVCGSLSKEFMDTHSLAMHAFNSLKVGLRTDHLGLHKALCVFMDWNWLIAPDGAKYYQSKSIPEAKALKEDLILWPPLVIIRNSSIGGTDITNGPKIVTQEGLVDLLKGIGIGPGKARVSRGKPANQSVMLVKFSPTFSGLQEAERLHKYYADNNRGRKGFEHLSCGNSSASSGGGSGNELERVLYGYMALAEDLDKVDAETKKRCIVKSKKEIEAIADAPLAAE